MSTAGPRLISHDSDVSTRESPGQSSSQTNLGRSATALRRRRPAGIGSEPGTNPRGDESEEFSQKCAIQVTDYSPEHVEVTTMSNLEFVDLMKQPEAKPDSRPPSLRWINIGGISWDVISAMALKYDLHALALEDILHEQGHNQSKSDYYRQHLFLRVVCHTLGREGDIQPDAQPTSEYSRNFRLNDAERTAGIYENKRRFTRLSSLSGFHLSPRQQQILKIASLKKGDRVVVHHEPMFIFLLREGTVISIRPSPSLEFTEAVTERIQRQDSGMRTSADPALVVQALLDLIVDRILQVMDEYQDKIHELERQILMKPGMSSVRSLHILSGDLILHKRTLEPIRSMIYGLRQYDQDRCAALGLGADMPANAHHRSSENRERDSALVAVSHNTVTQGYMSYKAKIYLADVYDHMDFVLTSLDMFAGISENLINYAFNMASYEMNQVMRRLTLATIIFLPLTLLTGYFGMNFTQMWSINNNSDVFFWIIALPVMGVIVPMFLYPDIKQLVHYVQKLMAARRVVLMEERAARSRSVVYDQSLSG